MKEKVRSFFTPPIFEDDEAKTRAAALLNGLLWLILAALTAILIAVPFMAPHARSRLVIAAPLAPALVGGLVLIRRGRVRATSHLLVWTLWGVLTLSTVDGGGVRSIGYDAYVMGVIIAGLLLGWRFGLLIALLSALVGLITLVTDRGFGLMPVTQDYNDSAMWFMKTAIFVVGSPMVLYFENARSIREMKSMRDNQRALAETNRKLEHRSKALQEREALYRALFENAPFGLGLADKQGNLVAFNEAILRPGGYTRQDIEEIRNVAGLYVDAQVRDSVLALAEEQGYLDQTEVQFWCKDGRPYDVLISLSPVHFKGEPHWQAMVVDISERKQAQVALQRRQRELESLLETNRNLSSVLDLDELLGMIGRRAAALLEADSYTLYLLDENSETLRPILSLGPYDDQVMAVVLQPGQGITGTCFAENRPILANDAHLNPLGFQIEGTPREEEEHVLAAPLTYHEKVIGAMFTSRLSGERFSQDDLNLLIGLAQQAAVAIENAHLYSEAQRRLKEQEALLNVSAAISSTLDLDGVLARIVEQMAVASQVDVCTLSRWDREADAVVTWVEWPGWPQDPYGDAPGYSYALRDFELTRAVLSQRKVVMVRASDPAADPQEVADMAESKTQCRLMLPLVMREEVFGLIELDRKEASPFTTSELLLCQALADQAAVAIQNAQLYEEVQRNAAELGRRIAERTVELEEANEHLRELSRVKDEFVSNVSHELRTPITNIKLYHSLLTNRPEKRETYMATLKRETERLEHIVEDLLLLSRLDQKSQSLETVPLDLNALVASYFSDRASLAESRQLNLALELAQDLPSVPGDEMQIGKALSALLTNALHYTPAGGQVVVATAVCRLADRPGVMISVSDTGPGVLPEERPKLFERFYRGKASQDSGAPGTGLGLSIVQAIVEGHQGQVEVDSNGSGRGATFSIWLPAGTD